MSDADNGASSGKSELTEVQRRAPGSERRGDSDDGETGRNRFDDLLASALEVPTPERIAFITANCEDPELRRELIELIAKEAQLDSFLERSAAEVLAGDGNERPAAGPVSLSKSGEAIEHLRQAVSLGCVERAILTDPDLNDLRGTPEFEALVSEVQKRIGASLKPTRTSSQQARVLVDTPVSASVPSASWHED